MPWNRSILRHFEREPTLIRTPVRDVHSESGGEDLLRGGNSAIVTRVGDTVRRPTGPWTPAVHLLLRALRSSGVRGVPEPLGVDEQGREILTFLPGEVGHYPLPGWVWSPSILHDAGSLLRRVHDASVPLVACDLEWQMPSREPREVICHNDVAPYNMTFVDGRLTGLFDFDMASPGSRVWDLAYLAYRLVPWGEDAGVAISDEDRLSRTEQLIHAYGLPFARDAVLRVMAERSRELAVFTDERLRDTGDSDFADHAAMYRRDAARIDAFTGRG